MTSFIWKPSTINSWKGGPVFLAPSNTDRSQAPIITGPDGQTYTGKYVNTNEGRHQWVFPKELVGMQGLSVNYGGSTGTIGSGAQSYEGGGLQGWSPRDKGTIGGAGGGAGGVPGGFAPGQIGDFGAFPAYLGGSFPSPFLINYNPIEAAPFEFTDPQQFAQGYGQFNRDEIRKNFDLSRDLALQELDVELAGLRQFVPAASALKRQETSLDNIFNQQQREAQVKAGLPGATEALEAQAGRAASFAAGRVPDEITDRALELGIRSRAADNASAGGFGARSSVARKASDLMSAEQRIALSQYGDQLTSANIQQRQQLLLAPTSYSDAGAQIRATPEVGGGRLAAQALSETNQQTLMTTQNAFSGTVQQRQFGTQLEQQTRQFNATNDLNSQQFNANTQNQFAMSKFQYDVGYAGTVAGAAQTNINAMTAQQQQAAYQNTFQDYLQKAQQTGQIGAVAGLITTALGQGGVVDLIKQLGGALGIGTGSGGTSSGGVSGGGSGGGSSGAGVGGGTSNPDGSITVPQGEDVPSGYTPVATGPDGGTIAVPDDSFAGEQEITAGDEAFGEQQQDEFNAGADAAVEAEAPVPPPYQSEEEIIAEDGAELDSFAQDTGYERMAQLRREDPATAQATVNQGNSILRTAGVYKEPTPGAQPVGVDNQGRPVYANSEMIRSSDSNAGKQVVDTLQQILDPTGVFSKEDASTFEQIGVIASDVKFATQLAALQQNGDAKGFVNAILSRYKQPIIDKLVTDPQNKAGLAGAYSAYQLYENWDRMSGAQKAVGLASLGIQGYKFATGENLANKFIVKPSGPGEIGLTVGQGLSLFQAGVNVYGLVKNWDQLNTAQKIAYGTQSAAQMAQFAQQYGLLGSGTQAAAVPGVSAASLASAGWNAAPQYGVGAVTGASSAQIPAGYTAVAATEGGVVAVPTGTVESAAGATSGSLVGTAAGVAGLAVGAYSVYENWGTGGVTGAANGAVGGTAVAMGLYALGATNPYLFAGIVAASALGGAIQIGEGGHKEEKANWEALGLAALNTFFLANFSAASGALQAFSTGKSKEQQGRDMVRDGLKEKGLVDRDNMITLADGTKYDVGLDGGGGEHEFVNKQFVTKEHADRKKIKAYDVDYTNDLDYSAAVGGSALMRLLFGGKNSVTGQLAGQISNAAIGNIGYGKEFSQENFSKMTANLRAMYAQSGIKSKADAYQLANVGFAEGRWNESDLVAMHQAFNMMYNEDGYATASKLMVGRHRGIEVVMGEKPQETLGNPILNLPPGQSAGPGDRPVPGQSAGPGDRPTPQGPPTFVGQLDPNSDFAKQIQQAYPQGVPDFSVITPDGRPYAPRRPSVRARQSREEARSSNRRRYAGAYA